MEKKVILFDLDNTLINRQEAAYNMYKKVVERFVEGAKENPLILETALQQLMTWDEYGSIEKSKVYKNFLEAYPITEISVEALCEEWAQTFGDYTVPFKHARETVIKVKEKYRVGMITNGTVHMQTRKLALSSMEDLFEIVIISGTKGIHKPDREIFLNACEAMNCLPQEAYYVGDTFSADVFGASNAGLTPIWIWTDPNRVSNFPVMRINAIEKLLEIV